MALASKGGDAGQIEVLRAHRDRFIAFAFAACDVMLQTDKDGRIEFASGAAASAWGKEAGDLAGQILADLVVPEEKSYVAALGVQLARQGRLRPVGIRLKGPGGRAVPALMGGFRYAEKPDHHYLALTLGDNLWGSDSGEAKRAGGSALLDKASFVDKIKRKVIGEKHKGADYKLTMVAVDGLEDLRQSHGAEVAEQVLAGVGGTLRALSMGGDTVGLVGDGKFGVVSQDGLDPAMLARALKAIVGDVAPDAEGKIGLQAQGLALDTAKLSEGDATKALIYAVNKFATGAGAGALNFGSLSEGVKVCFDATIGRIAKLRELIDYRQFQLAFQPIVDLKTRELHHFETLTRLEGMSSPAELVGFAEQVGLVLDFDLVVVQRVIDLLKDKAQSQIKPHLAVNVSALSLQSELFVRSFRTIMSQNAALKSQISVELTETGQIADIVSLNNVIQQLRKDGHEVSMDDVGMGTTSFEMLKKIHVDYAKIDGQYVQEALRDERSLAILKSIVDLCQRLKYRTVAEMIEDEDQAARMVSIGIDFGQGYLFGRPGAIEHGRGGRGAP